MANELTKKEEDVMLEQGQEDYYDEKYPDEESAGDKLELWI